MTDEFDTDRHFETDRIEKTRRLREQGDSPYVTDVDRDATIESVLDAFAADEYEDPPSTTYQLAGRVLRVNDLGSVLFADLRDETGRIQLLFTEEQTEAFDDRQLVDIGDFLAVTGVPIRTDTGERSIHVADWQLATKALRSPPTRTGFNERNRVRDRVGAMVVDDDLRTGIETRFAVIATLRELLQERDFREVDTPILHHTAGGARATPFETYCEALEEEQALRIAPELYLKRLVMGGFERIFEIGSVFRNEDIDTTHNPEFTMLELYEAYADYEDVMELTESLVSQVVLEHTGSYDLEYGGATLDFEPPWDRLTLEQTLEEYGGIPVTDRSTDELRRLAEREYDVAFDGSVTRGRVYEELYEAAAEDEIEGPLFVTDPPRASTPLCAPHPDDDARAERFEAVVQGVELANAYSELSDPLEQARTFEAQVSRRERGDDEAHEMDTDYVRSLGYGLPPTGGLGIGVDRLAMLIAGTQSIKDVLPFPMVARQNEEFC
ncbi:lysine--tRNA ligase [Natronobacterium gregoryi]|uniref:Lysine--tRNA ligase n=2 Tax=Natronobacterium gregoryi TaxID=44930 RepID=L0AN51_NATGS|nr:lysine--tRNA ligase [Natronobacterium gregoryi]AFZ74510.1 lysyl-tRNA synthetase (class II) [Natronobacterium gregoryi SP2]ELY72416.1 lysyl-tRNA ligase [Natronobacterium gregoryi SP2]PLK21744.1 lysine--tRNA ligase [Natronobacterium gregoryi SP2]SFI97873.1 lysyl-tRNA synthetase, class II [Natronobacterium gregoryi]